MNSCWAATLPTCHLARTPEPSSEGQLLNKAHIGKHPQHSRFGQGLHDAQLLMQNSGRPVCKSSMAVALAWHAQPSSYNRPARHQCHGNLPGWQWQALGCATACSQKPEGRQSAQAGSAGSTECWATSRAWACLQNKSLAFKAIWASLRSGLSL